LATPKKIALETSSIDAYGRDSAHINDVERFKGGTRFFKLYLRIAQEWGNCLCGQSVAKLRANSRYAGPTALPRDSIVRSTYQCHFLSKAFSVPRATNHTVQPDESRTMVSGLACLRAFFEGGANW
jgi:hypothetical protein